MRFLWERQFLPTNNHVPPFKPPNSRWSREDGAGCSVGILSNVAAKKKLFFPPQLDWSLISWQDLWVWFIAFLLTQLVKLCSAAASRTRTHTLKSKLSKGIFGPSAIKWLPSDVTPVYSRNPARCLWVLTAWFWRELTSETLLYEKLSLSCCQSSLSA